MSHNVSIHKAQTSILRELLFAPESSFAKLQKPTGLSSDHFYFHINKLIELGFVQKKARGKYALTTSGKEHANKLDTDEKTVERQPKVAVILSITRLNKKGEREFLMQERLKHPYYGFWGFPTGKIRWGESILEAANRELAEETGLKANPKYVGVYHERVKIKETSELIEDKIFHIIACEQPTGKLMSEFEGGKNEWRTRASIDAEPKKYTSYKIEMGMMHGEYETFVEDMVEYSETEF